MNDLRQIQQRMNEFVAERDWEQFHSPKNLSMALAVEAGELMEHFQWMTEEDSARLPADKLAEVEFELADILLYLVRIAEQTGIDLLGAVNKKMELNEKKYPAHVVRGSSRKYTEYN
ncbi:MAG: nucleotide pyrophosphohydrolase [Xanthomonadales bacterium]|nr:nucleotide pyrophosphohydrolase [Xanthomonadales bacterium]NIX13959.1 nucleotide pyrophosphohydrolase [Xanthomonadales bacterium]